jgi:predicted amidophosphoribosyltransferase
MFFPIACIGCHMPDVFLCTACRGTIPAATPLPFKDAYALFSYRHPLIRRALWMIKYENRPGMLDAFTAPLSDAFVEIISEHTLFTRTSGIIIVPIPQSGKRTRQRGYHHTARLAKSIARSIDGIPVRVDTALLKKIKHTIPQAHTKSKHERLQNVVRTMTAQGVDKHALVIIIDDVITTGATIQEAKRALKGAGARHIIAIALAH